ncbi:hypothetical protein A9K58_03925 [Stenotrophomonas maltophilia]|uniref:Lipoprotein n=1 Tax=Stenotrophomonas maltophilia TaxID=40324 RepID=A0A1A6Y3R3_STEMA|nr:hypothetical protein [Stenotrophomonas maltophilia]OBU69828.1 hypothetical protein A9K58_03925 [Stenotrophomonas maltophilia]
MRRFLLLVVPWMLTGCSGPTPPDAAAVPAVTATEALPVEATTAPSTDEVPAPASSAPSADTLYAAVAADADPPSVVLNRYVAALLNRDRSASDAAWAIPPGDPRHADDAALRQLQDLRTLRLRSEVPVARDDLQPPRLLEVPVQVRAVTATGTLHFGGWYRVQPSTDGRRWQIQSAQLRPTLD